MATNKTTFRFSTTLSSAKGNFISTVIFLPKEIVDSLPKERIRTKGTINGAPFALAPQHKKDGRRFFTVSSTLRKSAQIKVGDNVTVAFKVLDRDEVELPEELEAALTQDDEAMSAWKGLTPGMQRSVILYVTAVKNVDSRISRTLKSIEKAKAGVLSSKKTRRG
jgi:hypothetical protein